MTMNPVPMLFDRALIRVRRIRAAKASGDPAQFLLIRMAEDLCDRLCAVEREFTSAMVQGARGGLFETVLEKHPVARQKVIKLWSCDVEAMLAGPAGVVADD